MERTKKPMINTANIFMMLLEEVVGVLTDSVVNINVGVNAGEGAPNEYLLSIFESQSNVHESNFHDKVTLFSP